MGLLSDYKVRKENRVFYKGGFGVINRVIDKKTVFNIVTYLLTSPIE